MNARKRAQAKLFIAALALWLGFAFTVLSDGPGEKTGGLPFAVAYLVVGAVITFAGVFGTASLQRLWGKGSAVGVPLLLLVFYLDPPSGWTALWAGLTVVGLTLAAYLLLLDPDIEAYRQSLRYGEQADRTES